MGGERIKPIRLEIQPAAFRWLRQSSGWSMEDVAMRKARSLQSIGRELSGNIDYSTKPSLETQMIQRQIDVTNKQIDALVNKLYALTEEEINIVEDGKGKP